MRRVLLPTADKILEPFLSKDPTEILSRYLEDTGKRIAYAERFGANDEIATAIIDQIGKEYGGRAGRLAGEIYFGRVGDARSSIVDAALKIFSEKDPYCWIDSLQTTEE